LNGILHEKVVSLFHVFFLCNAFIFCIDYFFYFSQHYYKNGYGHKINWQQSCPMLSEMFFVMDETIAEIETSEDDEDAEG